MKDSNLKDEKYLIQSVERALKILDLIIDQNDEITVTCVCDKLGVNANMAYRLLMTMTYAGYLDKVESTGRFRITLKTLQLSRIAINSLEIRRSSLPFLEELWRKFGAANVNLAILDKRRVLAVARIDSEKVPITHHYVGRLQPPHATAVGKVLLSELDPAEVESIVESHGMREFTEKTIRTLPELFEELAKVRQEQLAWDLGEHIPGDNCVAAPVRDANNKIVAAVSLSAYEVHMSIDELRAASSVLRETANRIFRVISGL